VLPLFHVFAMTVVMNLGITIGAELLLVPRFDLQQVLKLIGKRRPTLFPGVPTIYTAINNVTGWWTENMEGSSKRIGDTFTVTFSEYNTPQKLDSCLNV